MSAFMLRGNGEPGLRLNGNGKSSNGRQGLTSPLQKFVEIKNKINHVFKDIEKYVQDTLTCLKDLETRCKFVPQSALVDVEQYASSIKTIRDVLARDHMKVVFFGRTSNGKSTVINAMLYSRVLPSGMGHTTRCFVQVESSPSGEKYILTENSPEPQNLSSLENLAHALCSKEMGDDSLVRVLWPKTDSKLLQNEVVLVDSPGIDLSPEFDSWIDKHCLDADVFVLVSNAESTLSQAEKNFFHRVSDRVSRPNIFILNNRWDASAAEPELIDKVREQHMKQFLRFLVEELGVCTAEEAKHRIFFVSAREALLNRLRNQQAAMSPGGFQMSDGYQGRLMEFEDFERQFELCISQSAIQTKFEAHIEKGKHIAACLHEMLEDLNKTVVSERETATKIHQEHLTQLRSSQAKYIEFLRETKEKIVHLSSEVQLKVSAECHEEIMRLENVIDQFHLAFSDDPVYLANYKKEFIEHVDRVITNELQLRCTGGLLEQIIATERNMVADVSAILPPDYSSRSLSLLQYRDPFRFTFAIHCHSLLDDFHEDLNFRFSLGLPSLIRRFTLFRSGRAARSKGDPLFGSSSIIPRPLTLSPDSDIATTGLDYGHFEDAAVHSLICTSAAYVANGGAGLLIICGLVYRTVGWRIIAVGASAYLGLYLYERLSWNSRAKERELKSQLKRHLAHRLNQLSHTITMNCDSQVTREVNEVLSRLQCLTAEAHQHMKVDVDKLQKDVSELEKIVKSLVHTKGHATFLSSELDGFLSNHFLKLSPTSSQQR